jgi:integrase
MLRARIGEYIRVRQATGFKFEDAAGVLRDFGRFAQRRGDKHVQWRTAVRWSELSQGRPARQRRLGHIRKMAVFLRAEDPRHDTVPDWLFERRTCRPLPYILTPAEIARLLAYAAQIEPVGSFYSLTFVTFYGLLVATGLRAREALRLRIRDFSGDALTIRQTKFRKTRCIPLHPTTAAALKRYLEKRRHVGCPTDHIFVSERTGTGRDYHVMWSVFRSICLRAGIGARSPSGRKPRLHDLRHYAGCRVMPRQRGVPPLFRRRSPPCGLIRSA